MTNRFFLKLKNFFKTDSSGNIIPDKIKIHKGVVPFNKTKIIAVTDANDTEIHYGIDSNGNRCASHFFKYMPNDELDEIRKNNYATRYINNYLINGIIPNYATEYVVEEKVEEND